MSGPQVAERVLQLRPDVRDHLHVGISGQGEHPGAAASKRNELSLKSRSRRIRWCGRFAQCWMRRLVKGMRHRALLTVLVLPAVLAAADLKVDHVTVAGTNLDAMRKALTAVAGFSPEYGGPHSNHATEMALVSFPDGSYLELMGIQAKPDPAAVAAHVWSKFLDEQRGAVRFRVARDRHQRRGSTVEIGWDYDRRAGGCRAHAARRDEAGLANGERGSGASRIFVSVSDRRSDAAREPRLPERQTDDRSLRRYRQGGDRSSTIWTVRLRNTGRRSVCRRHCGSRMRSSGPIWHGSRARRSCSRGGLARVPG